MLHPLLPQGGALFVSTSYALVYGRTLPLIEHFVATKVRPIVGRACVRACVRVWVRVCVCVCVCVSVCVCMCV